MSTHFGFTKLVVKDLEASDRFYTQVFGFKEVGRVNSDIAGREIDEIMYAPITPGTSSFILLAYADTKAPSSDEIILGFITQDMDGVLARAVAAGGSVAQQPRENAEHGVHVAFVADTEGHLIEIVQPLAA